MVLPQNTPVRSYSHTKHQLIPPLGQSAFRLATGTQRWLGCSPNLERACRPVEGTDYGIGIGVIQSHPEFPYLRGSWCGEKGTEVTGSNTASSTFHRRLQYSMARATTEAVQGPVGSQMRELALEGKVGVSRTDKRDERYRLKSQRQESAGKVLERSLVWLERKEQGGWGRKQSWGGGGG